MIRHFFSLVLFGLILGGCSDGGGSAVNTGVVVTQPDPTSPVAGGGVKGPLVNASVSLYLLDLSTTDLKGSLVSSGSTSETSALQGITITSGSSATYLLEITADDDTVDLNSGAAPILTVYRTVVSASAIRAGQVFATPITTLAVELAKQSGPFASFEALNSALNVGAQQVISTLGFGLRAGTDPFSSNPLLTAVDTSDEQQGRVLAYRLAVEGLAAILDLITTEILAADPNSTITVDDVLAAIAEDLSDGAIDGVSAGGAVAALTGVADINAVVSTDPALLMIPGTSTPITRIAEIVVSETGTTGVTVTTANITSGAVAVTARPARALSDIDGDGIPDNADAFPADATESVDTDGDGTGNNEDTDDDGDGVADATDTFPLLAAESLDTDGDGIGNNADTDDDGDGVLDTADALPLDATESIDTDGDGIGNNADTDDDGDGVADSSDAFPLDIAEQLDTDSDGLGNNADTDDDGDGVADADDNFPLNARSSIATSAVIGVDGGSITSPDGNMTLTFPANALSADTLISIGSPTTAATAELDAEDFPIEGHYLLEPEGTQFAEPVAMEWSIPSDSVQPGAIRLVYSLSDGTFDSPDEEVVTNLITGKVTTSIQHFSELTISVTGFDLSIDQPSAVVGDALTWTYSYSFDPKKTKFRGIYRTEGAFLTDNSGGTGIARQPELLDGEGVITAPAHEQVVHCTHRTADESAKEVESFCAPSREGTIAATCLSGSLDGLKVRMGFNFEYDATILNTTIFYPDQRARLRVEADGFCRDTIEITEPGYIFVGGQLERITETPEIIIDECSLQPQKYFVAVSNTRTSIVNTTGSCSRALNFPANDKAKFGALTLVQDPAIRLYHYGESGLFIFEPVDGFFGELTDFTSVATDLQHAVNDDGTQIDNQGFAVNNTGRVKLLTLNADGTNTNETAFNVFGLLGKALISFAPLTSTTGIGITSGSPSRAYRINFGGNSTIATEIGTVGDSALGLSCTRLACESDVGCSVTNDESVGCVVSAFDSEEVYPFFLSDVNTNALNTPHVNFTLPIPGIKTASPFTRSNAKGQLVIATVNENEIGKVTLTVRDASGTALQTAEFFLTEYESTTGYTSLGSSIVLIEPGAEFPNGAVRIGVDNLDGTDGGVLTIPVTEALLETSPEPFFGPAFSN